MCGCLSRAPYWGPGPQPRCVPWLGIEQATLWFAGQHLTTEPHQPELVLVFLTEQFESELQTFSHLTHRTSVEISQEENYLCTSHRTIIMALEINVNSVISFSTHVILKFPDCQKISSNLPHPPSQDPVEDPRCGELPRYLKSGAVSHIFFSFSWFSQH